MAYRKLGHRGGVDWVSLVISLGFRPLRVLEYVFRTADNDFERALLKMPDKFFGNIPEIWSSHDPG